MTILDILHYPDARLHLKAQNVTLFDSKLKELINNMANTMYENNGIGLAATQVNVQKRIFIIDLSKNDEPRNLITFINLEILEKSGEVLSEEGCLSVPGIYEKVYRSETIKVKFQDENGKSHQNEYKGLMSICIQHENDHLDGKVFVEYLSNLKQNFIKKKLKKIFKPE
ncbi:MAG: peptide deformylase [Proteobacteria bacterium]|jgi:peptide deformylase|nr:peptide deformylase [Pseudomonadota bacterium]